MTIRRGSEILGQTPFIFKGYKGRINLLVDDPGYLAQRIEVELYDFKSSSYHVNMKAHAGSLKIITRPAGARIFIEAHDKGVSVGPEGKEGFLLVKGLRPGKTNVWAEYKDQKSALQTVVIKRAETVDLTLDIPMPEKKTSPEAAPEK